ncbi:MAG TPA: four-helix bundle copper-binding protein [Egicoccus sp.]|nr:four-helix bundle copper-binding protein [Egicoccus sp.]HSK22606.1 four-helix bundle copper-binding protein [Egicoccus sp.]
MAVKDVLRDHGDQLRTDLLSKVIEAAADCAAHCDACADACLEEGNPDLVRCIRSDLDCADICTATAKVVARAGASGQPWLELVKVCMQACASCAEECEQHADMHDHCRACAEACRRCEAACRELLDAAG